MRSLFRAFDRRRVRYLVISGQASVLYGAAFFSQDLDLWVEPADSNIRSMMRALADLKARVHKLTPPPVVRHLKRGHGFHFVVPQRGAAALYLDVMGQPPRVGAFRGAFARAERMRTPWGELPVVSIEDLVEIKKTNRPADYEVVSRLAMIRLGREERPRPSLLEWALRNVFRVEDLWEIVTRHGPCLGRLRIAPAARLLLQIHRAGREPGVPEQSAASRLLAREGQRLQDRGRAYWIPRLRELRTLRAEGKLLPEGLPVSSVTGSEEI